MALEIGPSVRGVASEQATTPVDEHKIYVAVGKDAKANKSKIVWTVHQSGGDFKVCVVHVLVPSRWIPMGSLGARLPASSVSEIMLSEFRENEKINVDKILDNCLLVCKQMGVQAEKEYIESDSVEKGIVELIGLHGIRKLVMGAAGDNRYFKKMTEIRSNKAIFVRDKAHISCHIWFICDGHLIQTREAWTVQAVAEVLGDATSASTLSPGAGKSRLWKWQSAKLKKSHTTKLSNPFQDIVKRMSFGNTDRCSMMPIAASSSEQPNAATIMLERRDLFQEFEPVPTSLSHCPQSMQSVYHSSQSSISNPQSLRREGQLAEADIGGPKDPGKSLYAEKLEEELKKVKDQQDREMEELRFGQALKLRLENQFEETDQSRKELELKIIESNELLRAYRQEQELLQIDLENARQKAEEVSRRSKGDSLGTHYMNENDAQEELEEGGTTCAEAEVDIGGPKDPGKSLYAEKLEEELERVKDQQDREMEELRFGQALKLRLKNQFEETDQSRKELELKIIESNELLRAYRQEQELLQIDLENARQKAEEVSRRSKGDSLGTYYMNENDAQEELEEGGTTCAEAEVDIGRPKDPGKSLYAEKLEEELESVKDQQDREMEELRFGQALKLRLENQLEETDQSRKELELKIIECYELLRAYRQERELLQIDLKSARQKAEEAGRRSKGDSSGTHWRGCPRHLQVTDFHLGNLTTLDLSWSKVTKDWEGWDQTEMQNLRVLDLTGCADLLVTPKFSGCKNLTILILEQCSQLIKIDHSIGDLKCLLSLNLKFCTELSMLPVELGHLTALQELLMDGTLIQEIPISIGHLKQLETLSASNCCSLSQLPRTICYLTNISLISLDGTRITALPDSVGELVRLEHLSLRDCRRLRKIPNSIGNIGRSLVELDVSGTGISKFPNSLKNLLNLKVLRMDSCFFSKFPPGVGELTSLEEIHASWCRSLEGGIPSVIGKLHNLRILRLRHSTISSIPAEIHQLSNLQTLDLLHCDMIKELPRLPSSITVLYVDVELKSPHIPWPGKQCPCDEE